MRKSVVVDLDGTLMNTNTFKEYIIYTSKVAISNYILYIPIYLLLYVILRKLRLISHSKMKKSVLIKTSSFMNDHRLNSFVEQLNNKINSKVLTMLKQWSNDGYFILLSTAAPTNYASIISHKYEFNGVCATSMPFKDILWDENVKDIKKKNTLLFLNNNNVSLSILLTDHYDDIPLLTIKKELNYLINPSDKTLKEINKRSIKYQIIN